MCSFSFLFEMALRKWQTGSPVCRLHVASLTAEARFCGELAVKCTWLMCGGCLQDMKGGWAPSPGSNANPPPPPPPPTTTLLAVQPVLTQPSTPAQNVQQAQQVQQPKQDTSSKFMIIIFYCFVYFMFNKSKSCCWTTFVWINFDLIREWIKIEQKVVVENVLEKLHTQFSVLVNTKLIWTTAKLLTYSNC